MRASQIAQGTAFIKSVLFPQPGNTSLFVGIRALGPGEDDEVDRLAESYSIKQGVAEYNDTHPICVKARMVYTLAKACVDPDSDPCRPLPFFCDDPFSADTHTLERSAEIIRTGEVATPNGIVRIGMTPDVVVCLHEQYEVLKDEIHPQALTIKDAELAELCRKAAESDDFLFSLRPGLRVRLLRFTAPLALVVLAANFGGSSGSGQSTTKPSQSSQKMPLAKAKKRAKRK
jgi:hypothetical protein